MRCMLVAFYLIFTVNSWGVSPVVLGFREFLLYLGKEWNLICKPLGFCQWALCPWLSWLRKGEKRDSLAFLIIIVFFNCPRRCEEETN